MKKIEKKLIIIFYKVQKKECSCCDKFSRNGKKTCGDRECMKIREWIFTKIRKERSTIKCIIYKGKVLRSESRQVTCLNAIGKDCVIKNENNKEKIRKQ